MRKRTKELLRHLRERRALVFTTFLILIVLLLVGAISDAGGRALDTLGLRESGSITVNAPAHTQIYLDGDLLGVTTPTKQKITRDHVSVGGHEVLTARPQHYPWRSMVTIQTGRTTQIRPFHVPRNPSRRRLTDDDRSEGIKRLIRERSLPTYLNPRLSPSESIAVWVENGNVYARWLEDNAEIPSFFCTAGDCQKSITVIDTTHPVTGVDFYKQRDDVLIISVNNGIYALEISPGEKPKNFQPLYEGASPRFARTATTSISILDIDNVLQLAY